VWPRTTYNDKKKNKGSEMKEGKEMLYVTTLKGRKEV